MAKELSVSETPGQAEEQENLQKEVAALRLLLLEKENAMHDLMKNSINVPLSFSTPVKNVAPALPTGSMWRKDFKISGQIGEPGQKDRLTFSSLARQIENGLSKGYPESEITDAVVHAITPGVTSHRGSNKPGKTPSDNQNQIEIQTQSQTQTQTQSQTCPSWFKSFMCSDVFLVGAFKFNRKQVEAVGENEAEGQRDKQVTPQMPQVSRWSKYLDTPEEEEEGEEDVLMDRQLLHGNMIDRKRKRREGWTDREAQNRTPGQPNWSSLMAPVRPPATTRATSGHSTRPPSQSTGPVLKGAGFRRSDSQVVVEEESLSEGNQSVCGASALTCNDAIIHNLSLTRPRPLLPVSSMFESGEEFSFDDSELLNKL
ncbi:hypothetical protein L3Q82_005593 [Scortum barcoo]|uniref:Uncharacterized protein n=1 Tax=Scortum barcoo TaxID=214431 RepID=A0ACB8V637_9TELE|nr:hypothetical protein L3Q82_005593 [Scortum barcoo]